MKTVQTPKGTTLPLTNLKGRDYLMVAYRLQWLNEEVPNFTIETSYLKLEETYAVCRANVTLLDKDGKVTKSASATKKETKQDFADFTEKCETSAVGRALAMLGYGTQFALSDLDEGNRLADSPVVSVPKVSTPQPAVASVVTTTENNTPVTVQAPANTFKKPRAAKKVETPPATTNITEDGWS
jgi:hypothetical protein